MLKITFSILIVFFLSIVFAKASMIDIPLGAADSFAVLAGSSVTNTGGTAIKGDVGVSPGFSVTGLTPGNVTGALHLGDAVATQAASDSLIAYNEAVSQVCGTTLSGQDLGGMTLTPGVYCFSSSAQLTGILTLNGLGYENPVFLFQIGSTLTAANASAIVLENGAQGDDVFFQVGSSATLGTGAAFQGNLLAFSSITLNTGATIGCGRALAEGGGVTLDTNAISTDSLACGLTTAGTPEPGTAWSMSSAFLLGMILVGRLHLTGTRWRSSPITLR